MTVRDEAGRCVCAIALALQGSAFASPRPNQDSNWPAATRCSAEGDKTPQSGPGKQVPIKAVVVARYRSIAYRQTLPAARTRCPNEGKGGAERVRINWGYGRAEFELISQLSGTPVAGRSLAFFATGEWGPASEAHKARSPTAYLVCLKEQDGFTWKDRDAPLELSRNGEFVVPAQSLPWLGLAPAMAQDITVIQGAVTTSISGVPLGRLDPDQICRGQ